MSFETFLELTRRPITLLCALLLSSGPIFSAEKTWRTVEQLTESERRLYNPSNDTPRHPEIPYIPAEPYPFEPPYTAEEMGFRAAEFPHIARWSHYMVDVFGVVTSTGYTNNASAISNVLQKGRPGLIGYLFDVAPGEDAGKWTMYSDFPPSSENQQQIWVPKRSTLEHPTRLNFSIYSPSLRKVRRMPAPRRDDRFPDNAQTFDDVVGRDPWEMRWQLLGVDRLHESVRFPNTRQTITLDLGQGFAEYETSSIKMMGEGFPHYVGNGSVDCWVVRATIDKQWLPDYRESHYVMWLEKNTFYPLRIEKYGVDGKITTIEVRTASLQNEALGDFGYTSLFTTYWNVEYDLVGSSNHDSHRVRDWTPEEEATVFTPEFMLREWVYEPAKSLSIAGSPDQSFLRPNLYPEKFKDSRNVSLTPTVAARYAAQEKAGHLVFDSGPPD